MPEPTGAVFYDGPSTLTGAPIIGILTGLDTPSRNPKTGPLLQTYFLLRDVNPIKANLYGDDRAVCGDCELRGEGGATRACYVPLKWAPYGIWKAYHRGNYPRLTTAMLRGREVRLGSYGDPAAAPFEDIDALRKWAAGWTCYTHQWRTCDPRFQTIAMASVTTLADMREAQAAGWRTYRARLSAEHPVQVGEVVCPASAEAGHRVTCQECQLCRGTGSGAKSVVIIAHGQGAKHLREYPLRFDPTPRLRRA